MEETHEDSSVRWSVALDSHEAVKLAIEERGGVLGIDFAGRFLPIEFNVENKIHLLLAARQCQGHRPQARVPGAPHITVERIPLTDEVFKSVGRRAAARAILRGESDKSRLDEIQREAEKVSALRRDELGKALLRRLEYVR